MLLWLGMTVSSMAEGVGSVDKRDRLAHTLLTGLICIGSRGSRACDVKTHVFLVNTVDSLHVNYLCIFTGISVPRELQV